MFPQISQIQAQSHQQDLTLAAERAHQAAGIRRHGALYRAVQSMKRVRWHRTPKTAPASQAPVTVA